MSNFAVKESSTRRTVGYVVGAPTNITEGEILSLLRKKIGSPMKNYIVTRMKIQPRKDAGHIEYSSLVHMPKGQTT